MEEKIGSLATPESEIKTLREALLTQQQLLQKLYTELDKEREASASAASETLSMILRLQGEKAAMTMEASQYRRMAEEKMGHADESITILEDVIYQKEMQIWSLEYQIQAYKYKLLSLGVTEDDFPKGTVPQENGPENCIMRRLKSMPAMALRDLKLKPYWEQIRELDELVKEISKVPFMSSSDLGKIEKEASNGHSSSGVLDIFEVSETSEKGRASWPSYVGSKAQGRFLVEEGNFIGMPDLALSQEISNPSPSNSEVECVKHTVANAGYDDIPKKLVKVEPKPGLVCLKADVAECQSQLQQLRERVERLEDDRNVTREEMREEKEEDRNLLREIMEHLNSIQSGMESLQPKKPSSEDNCCLPLKEAMLHFWF